MKKAPKQLADKYFGASWVENGILSSKAQNHNRLYIFYLQLHFLQFFFLFDPFLTRVNRRFCLIFHY